MHRHRSYDKKKRFAIHLGISFYPSKLNMCNWIYYWYIFISILRGFFCPKVVIKTLKKIDMKSQLNPNISYSSRATEYQLIPKFHPQTAHSVASNNPLIIVKQTISRPGTYTQTFPAECSHQIIQTLKVHRAAHRCPVYCVRIYSGHVLFEF